MMVHCQQCFISLKSYRQLLATEWTVILLPLAAHIPGCSRCAPLSGWLFPGHTPPSEEPLPRTLARTHAEPPQRARTQLNIHWPLSKTQFNRWFKHKQRQWQAEIWACYQPQWPSKLSRPEKWQVVVSYAAERWRDILWHVRCFLLPGGVYCEAVIGEKTSHDVLVCCFSSFSLVWQRAQCESF